MIYELTHAKAADPTFIQPNRILVTYESRLNTRKQNINAHDFCDHGNDD